ncbi:putative ribonuclease H-like domain-containing protein [Tanacetum coccineum]
MIVEENLHVQFSENTPNIAGSGPNWLFDIHALTKSMNYKPVIAGNQSNGNAGTKACGDADNEKKVTEEPGKEGGDSSNDQKKEDNVNNTNRVNAASTNEVNVVDDDDDVSAEADMNNLNTFMPISPIPTTRIHKDHPTEQIIKDLNSIPQTRRMTKNMEEQEEPKKVIHALKDLSWIEAMQDELLQFKLQKVWTLVDLPNGKRPIGTKWVYKNKDERGIMITNKLDVKSDFLYGKIEEEVYVCQPPGFEDLDFPDRVYKVEMTLYGLHQAPRAWYVTLSTYLLDNGFQRGKIDKTLFIKRDKVWASADEYQVNPKSVTSHAVKRIVFRYLKST